MARVATGKRVIQIGKTWAIGTVLSQAGGQFETSTQIAAHATDRATGIPLPTMNGIDHEPWGLIREIGSEHRPQFIADGVQLLDLRHSNP